MLWKKYRERKSIRLQDWDYRTPGWYFVTICTQNRQHFFGEIRKGVMGLSDTGNRAYHNWAAIPDHFDHVKLDAWIIIPNHVHGLIGIMDWAVEQGRSKLGREISRSDSEYGRSFGPLKSGSLSAIIQAYKSSVTRWARKKDDHEFAWQPRFYEHIVRNGRAFNRIRSYIINNPLKWSYDRFY